MMDVTEPLPPHDLYPAGALEPPYAIIDVRSPVEIARGALPGAHALPLLSDDERHQVGLRYAEAGQEAAVRLGWELTEPHLAARVAAWRSVAAAAPTAVVCWRGGLRSALATELIDLPQVRAVAGGYKAVRRQLSATLPEALARAPLLVLTGLTGSGKTELLRRLRGVTTDLAVLDLEALARHRGSSFGAIDQPQPAQPTFEHELTSGLLLHRARVVVVEDESRFVGRRVLPPPLLEAMQRAPVALLETSLEERVARVFAEYVRTPALRQSVPAARAALDAATARLRRRLGGPRSRAVHAALAVAELDWFDPAAHREWIGLLLEHYYDRLYHRNRAALARPVLLRGDADALAEALLARAVDDEWDPP
jgi:tRNA 2-selenouridine synthase